MKHPMKRTIPFLLLLLLSSCSGGADKASSTEKKESATLDITQQVTSWTHENKNEADYYFALQVSYCTNPSVKSKQCLNIYVPSAYMNADGTLNREGKVGNYTCTTAPIVYLNSCGAYLGKVPYKLSDSTTYEGKNGWYYDYLKKGFVLVFAGERGRSDYDQNDGNKAIGKAPIGLSDLKAGIRYIKANKENFPGDTEKIISHGMSAGGAMSILLAVSGNSSEFDSYLQEMGAAETSDDVYAAQVYCPITDLEHADFAYEWYYGNNTTAMKDYSAFSKALSSSFSSQYIDYFNGLNLNVNGTTYAIGEDGRSGTFVDYIKSKYSDAMNVYKTGGGSVTTVQSNSLKNIDDIVKNIKSRSKGCPSFDALELTTVSANAENYVFGSRSSTLTSSDWARHFSIPVTETIASLKESYPEEYGKYYASYLADSSNEEVREQVKLYNPYTYLNANTTDIASKIRICVGTEDSDTAPAISACLALKLQSMGIATDYQMIWGIGHDTADVEGGFSTWVETVA